MITIIIIIIIFARARPPKTYGGGGFWVHDLSREPGDFDAAPVYRLAVAEAAAAVDVTRPNVGGGRCGGG